MYLWQEYHRSDAVFFPMQPIRWHMNWIIPLLMMFTLIASLRWCLPSFSTAVTFFLLYLISILWEGTLRLDTNPVLHKTLSLYQHGLMVSYFIQWFIIHYSYYWFCCLNCPRFGHRELHEAGFHDLTRPHHSLSMSLLSSIAWCSRLILSSPCLSPRISHFSKKPWFPLVENSIQKPHPGC